MILAWLIFIPLAAGVAAWLSGTLSRRAPAWIALAAVSLLFAVSLWLWLSNLSRIPFLSRDQWILSLNAAWIPRLGISFLLAADGLSLLLVVLTFFLGIIAVGCSWTEINGNEGPYYLTLLSTLAGIAGVFLALDLFLFYFFWELMLVPMYFLIAVWGHQNRRHASFKFFIFTQGCSLFLLLAILALYSIHGKSSGNYTFDYNQLLSTPLPPRTSMLLMLGFFIGFAVKLPVVPLHTWLPDAHTEAPTAGSVLLAGILLKTGAYGILRFVLPIFPAAALQFSTLAVTLAAIGIVYGAVLAFAQTDLKRMVAYTSVSHLGFVLLGIFIWNEMALQGAVMEMICHALSTGGLFVLVGMLYQRLHTRSMDGMGGLWAVVPRMSGVGMFLALASLGLPGLGNFVAEFLILLGTYERMPLVAAISAAGLVAATVYSLWLVQRVFHGPLISRGRISDLSMRELGLLAAMMLALIWLGIYPGPIFETAGSTVRGVLAAAQRAP